MDNENYKSKPRNVGRNRVNEKPKDLKLAVKKLIKYLNKFMPLIIIALVLAILSSVFSIIGPNKLSDLTDEIAKGIMTGIDFEAITSIAVFLLTIYLISALFNYIQGFIMATVANNFAKNLRTRISKKINKLPLRYFDTHSFGDILSRVTNDVDTIGMTLHQSLGTLVSAITLFIGSGRLHNRIYQIHPNQVANIKVDEHNKKTFILPNGEEKIVCADYTKEKEVMVKLALDLSLQYQLLEKIMPPNKEMHLVRELN